MTILVICLLAGALMLGMDLFTESRCVKPRTTVKFGAQTARRS